MVGYSILDYLLHFSDVLSFCGSYSATAHAAPLAQATRRIIDVEREPVVGLAASSITVVTLVYIVGSGGTALYNVLR